MTRGLKGWVHRKITAAPTSAGSTVSTNRSSGGEVRFADVVIHHTGYCDPALWQRKLQCDQRLVDLAEQPEHPFTLFNFGSILQEHGRYA